MVANKLIGCALTAIATVYLCGGAGAEDKVTIPKMPPGQAATESGCYDLTGRGLDCSQQPNNTYDLGGKAAPANPSAPPAKDTQLRDQLRTKLQADTQFKDALDRLMSASKSCQLASDPVEKAQLKAKHDKASSDLIAATNARLSVAKDDKEKEALRGGLTLPEAYPFCAQPSAPKQLATAPAAPKPAPAAAPSQARSPYADIIDSFPPQCRAQLNAFLEGSDRRDGERAYAAYGGLRADCDGYMKRLSQQTNSALPERKSAAVSGALAKAISGDAGRLVEGVGSRQYRADYDTKEVISFGLTLLQVVVGVAGVYSSASSGNTVSAAPRSVQSAPPPGPGAVHAPRSSNSTISGTK